MLDPRWKVLHFPTKATLRLSTRCSKRPPYRSPSASPISSAMGGFSPLAQAFRDSISKRIWIPTGLHLDVIHATVGPAFPAKKLAPRPGRVVTWPSVRAARSD